jgi:thiol-disulfide isomerase/thioredoxin
LPVDVLKAKQETINKFAVGFFSSKLRRHYKSEPIPEEQTSLVKKVVGESFKDIVLDIDKDVLFMSTSERCGVCKSIAPDYLKLAEHVKDIKDLEIVIMDSDKNKVKGLALEKNPTIMLFPHHTN